MKTDREVAEKARARAKKQNEAAREKWDVISCRLPKGSKDKITARGETVNGLINKLVAEWLDNN